MLKKKNTNWWVSCLLPFAMVGVVFFPRFSQARQENNQYMLRRGDSGAGGVDEDPSNSDPPTLTNCLLSAVSSDDCGSELAGCIWCAEPIYGLCVTPTAANKMKFMPFFTCDVDNVVVS
mmetsp:Transcript_18291/g.29619  ORF Transcript_18291/g.29619 Transcript_18291/m.29619 type:complete len:119 (+) Transcript_18291:116-472(+)